MKFQQKNGLLDCIEYRTVSPGKGAYGIGMIEKMILHRLFCQHYSEMIHLAEIAPTYQKNNPLCAILLDKRRLLWQKHLKPIHRKQ